MSQGAGQLEAEKGGRTFSPRAPRKEGTLMTLELAH